MRLVLDTNIVVSGLIWGGLPRRLLDTARDGEAALFTSTGLLEELAEVLSRDKFAEMLGSQGISPAFLLQRYGMLARLVYPRTIGRVVRDVDDDVVIGTALAAEAQVIATGDKDLLVMNRYQGIQILNPADALRLIISGG